jgi:hypothetical protein
MTTPASDPLPIEIHFADLNIGRALLGGATVGAGLVTVTFAVAGSLNGGWAGRPAGEPEPAPLQALWLSLPFLVVVFVIAWIAWLLGLGLVGAPGWWVLHRLRLRSVFVAIAWGFTATYLFGWSMTGFATGQDLLYPLPLAAAGAVVGAAVWFLAYRAR